MAVEMAAHAEAVVSEDGKNINAHVNIADLFLRRESGTVALNDIDMRFLADDSLTEASVMNRDLTARFASTAVLDTLLRKFFPGRLLGVGLMSTACKKPCRRLNCLLSEEIRTW